ncbi:MAG: SAM domain-containing protein [Gammaproteobacteria bacterium]|nr:SAM domain-containing protein [Gammaproteobacteria bacterium]MDH3466933.1 SAM domain-containing protein [Gammaproteobacteria bacterium]
MTGVRQWLDALGLSQYAVAFEENAIERLADLRKQAEQVGLIAAIPAMDAVLAG